MNIIFLVNLLLPILMLNNQHPVMYMIVILIQTIFLCLMMNMMIKTSWFSYILFLIFLGGLMVLFIYITSLASNEKFNLSKSKKYTILLMAVPTTLFLLANKFNQGYMNISPNMTLLFKEMYYSDMMYMTIMSMVYLLLTLIVVIKLIAKYKGPIRSMIN